MDFESLVERLKENRNVDGLLFLGSTGQATLNAHSDRDLLIVLNERGLSITSGTVYCGGILIDLIMVTLQQVEELVRTELGTISLSDSRAIFFNWVPSGVIALDRSGSLKLLRDALKRSESSPKLTEGESVSRSNHAIYNLAQTQRMSDSPDPVYEQAVDLRMLYQLSDLMVDYFNLRGLPWRAKKKPFDIGRLVTRATSTFLCVAIGRGIGLNASVCMPNSSMRRSSRLGSHGMLAGRTSCCLHRRI